MRWFRLSIAWLMFAVTVIAVDCAVLRTPGGQDNVSQIRKTGLVFTASILAIGLFRILLRRDVSHPRIVRFEILGLTIVMLFALAPYLLIVEALARAVNRVIGAISNRLIILFWHPLSDFDHEDPFGRTVTYVIIILLPAMLLAAWLSGLAFVGAVLWRRKA